jgi:hypothetical protein
MTRKETFLMWLNESGLNEVYEELDKELEVQLKEIQIKKPKQYKEIKQCEIVINSQKKNVKCSG